MAAFIYDVVRDKRLNLGVTRLSGSFRDRARPWRLIECCAVFGSSSIQSYPAISIQARPARLVSMLQLSQRRNDQLARRQRLQRLLTRGLWRITSVIRLPKR